VLNSCNLSAGDLMVLGVLVLLGGIVYVRFIKGDK
jgi:hypothetical protein